MPENADFTRLTELLLSRQDQQQQQLDRLTALAERQEETARRLEASLAKTDEVLATFGQVQFRILEELEKLTTEQVRSNRAHIEFSQRQEKFNERQDQFNIIFLDEIRDMKKDIQRLTEVVLTQHEGRLKRLEDFMNGFQSAA